MKQKNTINNAPKCHYCGQFLNIKKEDIGTCVKYGFMEVDYQYYYHNKCKKES